VTWDIRQGHVLDRLREMPSGSVHCVVTSPPYWGLRDYDIPPNVWGGDMHCKHQWASEHIEREMRRGVNLAQSAACTRGGAKKIAKVGTQKIDRATCSVCGAWHGCYGLEPTIEMYLEHTLEIFREIHRVLRDDGTLWLNIGDSYANGTNDPKSSRRDRAEVNVTGRRPPIGLKPKDLCGMPWRVAFALQADGWYLRRDIIWNKSNPMPESITDRPSTAHEYIFLLSKSIRYFYDAEAVREKGVWSSKYSGTMSDTGVGWDKAGSVKSHDARETRVRVLASGAASRNLRSVWKMSTQPFSEAHFATFPIALPLKCIKAGTSLKGVCPKCGAPHARILQKKFYGNRNPIPGSNGSLKVNQQKPEFKGDANFAKYEGPITTGWKASCECNAGDPIPATVLDPFSGAASTGVACVRLDRNYIGLELNPEYIAMSERRLKHAKWLHEHPGHIRKPKAPKGHPSLFTEEATA
jgi:DNA modification methylase